MCPRRDLNPETGDISLNLDLNSKTGEKSPDRGVHAVMVAAAPPAWAKRAPLSRPWRPGRGGVRENLACVTDGSGMAGMRHAISADMHHRALQIVRLRWHA
jgi:hypothetical protein